MSMKAKCGKNSYDKGTCSINEQAKTLTTKDSRSTQGFCSLKGNVMTVKELIAELARSPNDADKLVYVSTRDVSSLSNTTHDIEEVFFYKDAVVIEIKKA